MDFQSSVDLHNRVYEQLANPLGDISDADLSDPHMADWKYKKIKEQIKQFEDGLDNDHEIAICLASFGTAIKMAVHDIGFQNPDMLYFYGKVNDQEAQLIQHMSQLNFLLLAVPKPNPAAPPRRIGFTSDQD